MEILKAFRNNTSPVVTIRLVVVSTGVWPNRMSDNHIHFYLILQQGGAVRINMAAAHDDPKAILIWSQTDYQLSRSAITHWDYAVAAGVLVAHVYRATRAQGHHRYIFSGGGSGCRFWACVLSILFLRKLPN